MRTKYTQKGTYFQFFGVAFPRAFRKACSNTIFLYRKKHLFYIKSPPAPHLH